MKIKIASVDSVIVYFSEEISTHSALMVKNVYNFLINSKIEGIIEIIPSYTSILITYDIFKYDFEKLKELLEQSIILDSQAVEDERIITIDVYYGLEVGFDLLKISSEKKLSISDIIRIHSENLYDVYAIGFLPGFAYLGNVNEKISIKRLESPRKEIPKGSVGIADTQTAIYPQNSPGGWNIIGRTAMELFDKKLDSLCPLKVGDKVKFKAITKEEFLKQGGIL